MTTAYDKTESTAERFARSVRPTIPQPATQAELNALARQFQQEIELSVEECVTRHEARGGQLYLVRAWLMLGLAVCFSLILALGGLALGVRRDVDDLTRLLHDTLQPHGGQDGHSD